MKKTNKLTVGILADVDAGKTTLSESVLFKRGTLRALGRVDHGNAFLDTFDQEKARGITIFSKQAVFSIGEKEFTLLDTPGHTDFSAETERTLNVLDYAVLVISGGDGVTGPVRTLWNLLERYGVPVFIFINKMDLVTANLQSTMADIQKSLGENCILFNEEDEDFYEKISLTSEEALEEYIETGKVEDDFIRSLIKERLVVPVFYGSALKMDGIDDFLAGFEKYTDYAEYPEDFGARVYKISRDDQGRRLTSMKITGGSLKVRDTIGDEKVNEIRVYNGSRYSTADIVYAGTVCTVAGPEKTYSNEGLGFESDGIEPLLDTVLTYEIILPADADIHKTFKEFESLNEELPELHIVIDDENDQIRVQMMGEMQKEILQTIILNRFGMEIDFGSETILYRETIADTVEGVGHFEPLRHYAEVHLVMSPLPAGTGLVFETSCSEDVLDKNWQRLIMTHLLEKEYTGVLTNSPITDMRISIAAGRAHQKHTSGGDFREATYRAVRQGLCKAQSVLLEPYYDFRLEIPQDMIGRAMTDIDKMYGKHNPPEITDSGAVLTGRAPVSTMSGYSREVLSYTRGEGSLFFMPGGYYPCHNTAEVVENIAYNQESDIENQSGSVFCSHGGGVYIPWDEVEKYMHVESVLKQAKKSNNGSGAARRTSSAGNYSDAELAEIFLKTYGVSKRDKERKRKAARVVRPEYSKPAGPKSILDQQGAEEILLIDGYNMIFAWPELKEMSQLNLEAAREYLIEILHNYQGYSGRNMIVVFDAYKQVGSVTKSETIHNLQVIYTKEGQTADQYIEKYVLENVKKKRITVATSDGLEQMMIFGQGALRMPARELREKVIEATNEMREKFLGKDF